MAVTGARGFTETDYARFLDAAHQQLNGPVVLVWDNLNTHLSRAMAELVAARSWLTVYRFPPCACELNPAEAAWPNPQNIAGEPHQAKHRPADCAGQDPAQKDAGPGRPPRPLPGQDRTRPE